MAIDLTSPSSTYNAPDINFKDWQTPDAPGGTGLTLPSWKDSFDITPPAISSNKPFPEYAVINPEDIMHGVESIFTGPDVAFGLAKKVIPGVGGIGDILGGAGNALDQSPFGFAKKGIEGTLAFGENYIGNITSAIGNRAGEILGEIGKTFDSTNPDGFKFVDAPLRIAGSAILGKTGAAAFDFGKPIDSHIWDNLPGDLKDTAALASVVPLLKGLGMAQGALGGTGLGLFGRGLTNAFESTADATLAEHVGALTGRVAAGLTATGLATEFALPKIAPNEPWARDIMNNRVLAQDSPWRMPYEIALTLPLDLFQLGRLASDSGLAAHGSSVMFGTHDAISGTLGFTKSEINNAVNGGLTTQKRLALGVDYAVRQLAEDKLVDIYKYTRAAQGATEDEIKSINNIKDVLLPDGSKMTQDSAVQRVKGMVDTMLREWGPKKVYDSANELINRDRNGFATGWKGLDTAGKIENFNRYADLALDFESKYPDRLVTVARDTINVIHQAPDALDFLETAKAEGLKNINEADFLNKFPAMENGLKNKMASIDEAIMELKSMVGDTRQSQLDSLRASLREANEKLKTATETGQPSAGMAKRVSDLEQQVYWYGEPSVGTLEARITNISKRIVAGETDLAPELKSLTSKLNGAREGASGDILKQIETIQSSMLAREEEVAQRMNLPQGTAIRNGLDAEYDAMNQELADLNSKYMESRFQGTRWELSINEGEPVMQLKDETGLTWLPGERTVAGKAFDALFAGIPNKRLAYEANQFLRNALSESNTPVQIQDFLNEMSNEVLRNTHESATGFVRSKYGSIYHLDPNTINRIATPTKEMIKRGAFEGVTIPKGYSSASELIYRSFPGPLKIFQEQVFGKALDIPYNQAFHTITRTLYPMLRFYFSPRFLAMNMYESKIIGGALGGVKFFQAPEEKFLTAMAGREMSFSPFGILDVTGSHGAKNLAKLAFVKRPDELSRAIIKTVESQPEMGDILKNHYGTQDQWYQGLADTLQFRENIIYARNAATTEEKALASQIEDLKLNISKGYGDEIKTRAQLNDLNKQFTEARLGREYIDQAAKEHIVLTKDLEPAVDRFKFQEMQLIDDMRRTFYGNPERSAVERLSNSFLMYWPISYQLKAGRDLMRFLTSSGLGFQTGMTGATAWAHLRQDHENKLASDPEYAAKFAANKNLLFTFDMMLPVTPESLGVTLSPEIRAPAHIFAGKETPSQALGRFNFGPAYDLTLAQRVTAEQLKKGGLLHDLFGGDNNE